MSLMEVSRFLLVSLTMDAILEQTTAHGRRRKLRVITEGLDLKDIYGTTLERIKRQGGERARLGMATLMWVSHSERLLQIDELLHALAVEIGSTDLNAENIPSVETLLSCCLGLVVVDGRASTGRLIHFTLQEYPLHLPRHFRTDSLDNGRDLPHIPELPDHQTHFAHGRSSALVNSLPQLFFVILGRSC